MTDAKLILIGGAVGLVAVGLWKYFKNANAGIDPTTGGVPLPAGSVYGPPAVAPGTATVEPGPIVEGLN